MFTLSIENMVGLPQLKQELDQVTEANVLQGSAFVTGPISSGLAWDENVWTKISSMYS